MAIFRGGPGNDRVVGGKGSDQLFGFNGNDLLIGRKGADVLNGGVGAEDVASYQRSKSGVVADLSDPSGNTGEAQGDTYIGIERLVGSKFDDELRGGVTDSVLFGGEGDDTLIGQSATTVLIGGAGADTLVGLGVSTIAAYWNADDGVTANLAKPGKNEGDAAGDTFDTINGLHGSDHRDKLSGDKRDNVLSGLRGNDVLKGGSGNDELFGGDGRDKLSGGKGFDTAGYGGSTTGLKIDLKRPDKSTGDAAGDTFKSIEAIDGSRFDDRLFGDNADNRLSGELGADVLKGRDGADLLQGGLGDDRLFGGGENDTLSGGLGADLLKGGGGIDKAVYWTAASGLTVDLAKASANTGEARGDTFSSVEGVDGSNFSDILRGDDDDNRLFGRDGDDRLDGRDGADLLFGGRGDDDLRGGDGDDILIGGDGADRFDGGADLDAASYLEATSGVTADLGDAAANTGEAAGDTYRDIENLTGSRAADTLRGDAAINRLSGGGGDDVIEGGGGDDRLIGQAGNDTLSGGDGDDSLVSGEGRDFLTGGAGADTFFFANAPSPSAYGDITDFEVNVDTIALARFQYGALPAGELAETAFHSGATATLASHRVLYDSASGDVRFDGDGAGGAAAIRFATIAAGFDISADDFLLV